MEVSANLRNFLFTQKMRWGLSWPSKIIVFISVTSLTFLLFCNLYSILSPVDRQSASILVLEGATNDHVLIAAMNEFKKHPYQLLITTGTPLEYGAVLSEYKNTASIAGQSLIKLGFDSTRLIVVESDAIIHDRTFNSAIALKQWFRKHQLRVDAINLMSMGVHGGRSRMLFSMALGDSIKVGVISVPNQYYSEDTWWKSSKGFRETLNEALGYFYTKYFFRSYEIESGVK